jgi:murein DD-endopeptidase MepM/ murein hydrolase activator NlpD
MVMKWRMWPERGLLTDVTEVATVLRRTVVAMSIMTMLAWAVPAVVVGAAPAAADSGTSTKDLTKKKASVDAQVADANSTYEAASATVQKAAADYTSATAALPGAQSDLAKANGSVVAASVAVDQANAALTAARAAVAAANATLASADQKVIEIRSSIADVVNAVYQGSPFLGLNALLTQGTPSEVLNGFAYADQIGLSQRITLNGYLGARMAAKDSSNTAGAAERHAQDAQVDATGALARSQDAKAAATQASDNLAALVAQRQEALAVAQKYKATTLAQYKALQAESDQVAVELRAAAARDKAAQEKAARDKAARDKAARDKAARDKATKDKATKDKAKGKVTKKSGKSGKSSGSSGSSGSSSGSSGSNSGTHGYFIMPIHGWKSSNFGMRYDPVYKVYQLHAGVDIAAPGGTPIKAAKAGRVIRAGWAGGYGNYTCIDNGLYGGKGIATCYAHQSRILVRVGQHVSLGQVIGRVGETGAATGYHLHFEVRINGKPVQPLNWLPQCFC